VLEILDASTRLCDGLTRRDWLKIGSLGLAGLSLPNLLQARHADTGAGRSFGQAKACIIVNLLGGPPQHETWDPKPDAPAEIRGPYKPIASKLPGLSVCELMPRTAAITDKCTVLRAMSTRDNAHSSSGYYMLTGVPHAPMNVENARPGAPNDWPSLAAVVKHLSRGPRAMPVSIQIPEHIWNTGGTPWPGQDAGWLGRAADPWMLHCDPSKAEAPAPALALPSEVPALRFDGRRSLLTQVNSHLDFIDHTLPSTRYNDQYRQAFDLLRAPQARRAFDLDQVPLAERDRYGRHRFGQSVLLARRLVEAGVRLVQVNWTRVNEDVNFGTWDTHAKNAEMLKAYLMPMLDQSVPSLIADLDERGRLDSTLVVVMSEFGRSPKHNGAAGRDHWGSVFSIALAGGGIRRGVVYGASDKIGAQPKDGRVRPEDLIATIFHCLGLNPETELRDALGRPVPISRGEVVSAIV
jgi:hypothetical protein